MKKPPVVVIGAGMGGLTAAIRLAQRGLAVQVIEANPHAGGLAAPLRFEGLRFDAGPYILLDRPGLEWAFQRLGLELSKLVPLQRIEHIYAVETAAGPSVVFYADAQQTADGMERHWPGSARRYLRFVAAMRQAHARLQPLLYQSRPGLGSLLASGGWRDLFFLSRSLASVLRSTRLAEPVVQAIAIWTHVAGQTLSTAPSPLAFVPALLHDPGAFYPVAGIGTLVDVLRDAARAAGVELRYGTAVKTIRTQAGAVTGVELAHGEFIAATTVLSNAHGIGTYLDLLRDTPDTVRAQLQRLPLQSPGICAYLAVKTTALAAPYLRFRLPDDGGSCRLLVMPSPAIHADWSPARLIVPMRHAHAQQLNATEQRAYAEDLLAEPWWRAHLDEARVLHVRTPSDWGAAAHLHRDSMNPVMTASFMRAGRLAHRSPQVAGLHLAGSSTHPGQWLSFAAISGILAADQIPC